MLATYLNQSWWRLWINPPFIRFAKRTFYRHPELLPTNKPAIVAGRTWLKCLLVRFDEPSGWKDPTCSMKVG
ncbi:hypothetical protein K450DRAFT_261706 [Umbelopsis ramanniana AG]|uniref:Uncharacterized protein n=1 Tax=Umbelopsis ramanniana AG TaxID=1314678 RepID=A0AAD5E2X7_UMBRA|nr:uncharacterized protein K450DRAFT_261706 [Umbelopsis ramanniana AG]KAI8575435.1 hypothetical protein K450DRAFT_261706 [Umbelopsis ramanniana AG]